MVSELGIVGAALGCIGFHQGSGYGFRVEILRIQYVFADLGCGAWDFWTSAFAR